MSPLDNHQKNDEVCNWKHPIERTGGLVDIIVATLSIVSIDYGIQKIRFSDFYRLFARLENEFPLLIPRLGATTTGGYTYSKTLGSAVERALRRGVHVANPRLQYLEVTRSGGEKNLKRIQKRASKKFLDNLKPVAKRLAELMKEESCIFS
jgi:hypothetical protein